MSNYTVLPGDCLTTLRTLPAESVHCVVTSPPYFGLRDYGTASWKGGDPECDHVANAGATKKFGNAAFNESRPSREDTKMAGYYAAVCPRCGAIRIDSQIGLEPTPAAYVARLVEVFREVWRVLRPDGTAWLNLGDSYNGSGGAGGDYGPGGLKEGQPRYPGRRVGGLKPKDLIGVPWRVAFALQDDGWWLRSDIIWSKPNPMPESVTDRPTKAHEYVFLLAKSERYFYDAEAVKERATNGERFHGAYDKPGVIQSNTKHRNGRHDEENTTSGRNRRSVWTVATQPYAAAHFATFPPALIEPCILAGTSAKGVCPQCGAQWGRVVERESKQEQARWSGAGRENGCVAGGGHYGRTGAWSSMVETTGWQPSCECFGHFEEVESDEPPDWMDDEIAAALEDDPDFEPPTPTKKKRRYVYVPDGPQPSPVPAVVLDPFAGSGTTLAVALKHGRAAIGCELNPEYIDLIHQRCAEMSTEPIRVAGKVDDWADLGLFAEVA